MVVPSEANLPRIIRLVLGTKLPNYQETAENDDDDEDERYQANLRRLLSHSRDRRIEGMEGGLMGKQPPGRFAGPSHLRNGRGRRRRREGLRR